MPKRDSNKAMYLSGIVEGFYGRQWSWGERRDMADYLATLGANTYLYCPKGDAHLRRRWREDWPEPVKLELRALAEHAAALGLVFGVGLSPLELYRSYDSQAREQLERRIHSINELGGGLLAVLFDDMRGDWPGLAEQQLQIMADVQSWSEASRLLLCPTYYSFDPKLEQVFGPRPQHYWQELGDGLDAGVDVFWTGPQVCSPAVTRADAQVAAQELGRNVVLWDNYPVNDGAKTSDFLHLRPLAQRDQGLSADLRGHLLNPMNQPLLSRSGLSGLADLIGRERPDFVDLFGDEMAGLLLQDIPLLQDFGRSGLSDVQHRELLSRYENLDHPAARELLDWLAGGYQFDPACLTD